MKSAKQSGESCSGRVFGVSSWGWGKAGGGGRHRVWVMLRKRDSLKINGRDPHLWQGEKVGV